jgi:two-component sensor histidine kinase
MTTLFLRSTRKPALIAIVLAGVWTGTIVVLLSLLSIWLVPGRVLPETFTPAAIYFFAVTFFGVALICGDLRRALWRARERENPWGGSRLTVPAPNAIHLDAITTDLPIIDRTTRTDGLSFSKSSVTALLQTDVPDLVAQISALTIKNEQDQFRYQLLLRELAHRARNVFSVVLSIAQCSLRTHAEVAAYEEFEGRLIALSRAQDLLNEQERSIVNIGELIDAVVSPFSGGRVSFAGPTFHVPSRLTLPFALALHELCTNACKYGALSTANGQVSVAWEYECGDDDDVLLCLCWTETGGPVVTQPSRQGFGTRMIRTALASNPGSNAELQYCPEGLVCNITVCLGRATPITENDSQSPADITKRATLC